MAPTPVLPRIPVVILSGFLGAGKTTVLNWLLRNPDGARIGVVVNDFGQVNVDAILLEGQVDITVGLPGGCLCCAVDINELDDALASLAKVSPRLDLIVIEASGLAEPRTICSIIARNDSPGISYGGLIQILDAEGFAAARLKHPELERHVAQADLVVVNKRDLVSDEALAAVTASVADIAAGTPLVSTERGIIPLSLVADIAASPPETGPTQLSLVDLLREGVDAGPPLHSGYTSVAITTPAICNPRLLVAALEAEHPGLYRVKGVVAVATADGPRLFSVARVGRHLEFAPYGPARQGNSEAAGAADLGVLVFLGVGLDADALRAAIAYTAAVPGTAGSTAAVERAERDLLAIQRFLR